MNVNESPDEFMVYPMCQYSWNEIFSMDPLKKILECVGTRMHIFLEKKSMAKVAIFNFKSPQKVTTLRQNLWRTIYDKSGNFKLNSFGENSLNISANQRLGLPSWICCMLF